MHSAVVIGSGPNGLAAAIQLALHGVEVEVREAATEIGGGTRSGQLTLPGFTHDLGSAIHPMAMASPFFRRLPLSEHGLRWVMPPAALAHPLDGGRAVILEHDLKTTAASLGVDRAAYTALFEPMIRHWHALLDDVLKPQPAIPRHPLRMAGFGIRAVQPAALLARTLFKTEEARALFAGCAGHSFLRMEQPMSSAFGMMLGGSGHAVGWPMAQGGSQSIANALGSYLRSLGGRITTNAPVEALGSLGTPDLVLCDVTPRQFLHIARDRLPAWYGSALSRYRYGPGVFKVDWALREPIPWQNRECLRTGTVHLGGTLEEIAASERAAFSPVPSVRPFVLLAQQSLFDRSRAPAGQHTAWAYCHVPNGWTGSRLAEIEGQIERFAPGFQDVVLAKSVMNTAQMQGWNGNLVGGDINGGAADLEQFILRPTISQYRTPLPGVYLCSSSTPPGGAVHGMCGYHAASWALNYLRRRTSRSQAGEQQRSRETDEVVSL